MFIIDLTNPLTLILLLIATVLLIFLGKEIKKPHAPALMGSLGMDFIMIFISFFGYLWVDDISCKFYKKKNIDNSLDWFWNKV